MARKNNNFLLPPVHPGEILREDLMLPLQLSVNRLARDLRVPVTRIGEIVHGRRGITADTALRLSRYFSTTPEFWMNLQSRYELQTALRERHMEIERDVQPREPVSA
jgi:addiction module HigA family antidote